MNSLFNTDNVSTFYWGLLIFTFIIHLTNLRLKPKVSFIFIFSGLFIHYIFNSAHFI